MFSINPKHIDTAKEHLTTAKNITFKVLKYGTVFGGGVLVGTVCGVVLFFHISNDPT